MDVGRRIEAEKGANQMSMESGNSDGQTANLSANNYAAAQDLGFQEDHDCPLDEPLPISGEPPFCPICEEREAAREAAVEDDHDCPLDTPLPSDGEPPVCAVCEAREAAYEAALEEKDWAETYVKQTTQEGGDGTQNKVRLVFIPPSKQRELDATTYWVIPNVLPLNATGCLSGLPGTRKSFLALDLAICVANGVEEFLGYPIQRNGPVLYVAADDGPERTVGRLRKIARYRLGSEEYDRIGLLVPYRFSLQEQTSSASIKIAYDKAKAEFDEPPALIIIDTAAMAGAPVEDFGHSYPEKLGWLKSLARALKCTVVLVDHQSKPTADSRNLDVRIRAWGSMLKAGFFEFAWALDKKADDQVDLTMGTKDGPPPPTLVLSFGNDEDSYSLDFTEASSDSAPFRDQRVLEAIRGSDGPATVQAIAEKLQLTRGQVRPSFDRLVRSVQVRVIEKAQGNHPAKYEAAPEETST